MLSERRKQVLRALVQEYVRSGQPVSSGTIVERYTLSCSPATVRNELAALEESGHVLQPHVSAGRVPTDTGYRAFVDGLLEADEDVPEMHEGEIRRHLQDVASELDELMHQTSHALADLTHYVAVVLAPTISMVRIRRIDLLSITLRRAVLVVITESGQVVNRQVELPEETSPERLSDVERALNASLDGKRAFEVRTVMASLDPAQSEDGLVRLVIAEVVACLEEADTDRLYHVGVPELLALPEFAESVRLRPLIGLLEDGLAMLETLREAMRASELTVRIGSENTRSELEDMSLVVTNYGSAVADGVVGVIGPTRMDYRRSIAAVRYVAEGLNDALG